MLDDVDSSQPSANRTNLEMALAELGFESDARFLAHDLAAPILVSRPTTATVNSRVGGPALLPPSVPWPTDRGGVALSFVAVVDLSEVRAVAAVPQVPSTGWLVLFARLECGEFVEPDDSIVQLFRSEEEPFAAEGPAGVGVPQVLPRTPVVWEPHMSLPDADTAGIADNDAADYMDFLAVLDDVHPHSYPLVVLGGFPDDAEGNRGLPDFSHVIGMATDFDEVLVLPQQSSTHLYAPVHLGETWTPSDLRQARH